MNEMKNEQTERPPKSRSVARGWITILVVIILLLVVVAVAVPFFIPNRNTANSEACRRNLAAPPKGKVSVIDDSGRSVWVSPEDANQMKANANRVAGD